MSNETKLVHSVTSCDRAKTAGFDVSGFDVSGFVSNQLSNGRLLLSPGTQIANGAHALPGMGVYCSRILRPSGAVVAIEK